MQDVGVDHGHRDVAMAEELLHGADVVAALEEVRGKRVPEGVARHPFGDSGRIGGTVDRPLDDRFVEMMAAFRAFAVSPAAGRGKDPRPRPLRWCGGILPRQGVGKPDPPPARGKILLVGEKRAWGQVPSQWSEETANSQRISSLDASVRHRPSEVEI